MFDFDPESFSTQCGVYLMKDGRGRILYVGKAKNLRKRLSSYFRERAAHTAKTRALLGKVERIDTLITSTEKESLLLEESLIKKHRPRYNVVLRDDKQYVLFRLSKTHQWPRLTLTRRITRDGSVYFGPFTSAASARETWKLVGKTFGLRRCSDHVLANRMRPCLYHYIHQCLAPCVGAADAETYAALVARVEQLLAGRSQELARGIESEMLDAAERLEFEKAAALRDQLAAVRKTVERQSVVMSDRRDLDVLDLAPGEGRVAAGLLFIREGRLIGQKSFIFPGLSLEDGPEIVEGVLGQFYSEAKAIPPLILTPWPPEDPVVEQLLAERRGGSVRLREAKGAEERQLADMARKNAQEALRARVEVALDELLRERLHLSRPPLRIECVDASHLAGQGLCVGQVVFEAGEPKKDAYRLYNFPELEGTADDYLALASWARRRLASGEPWPDLVLVDGGRGQLGAVARAMEEEGQAGRFELASIAKAGRAAGELGDEVFLPGRKNPLPLKPGSPELLFLQRLRDTAHRFVLGRQRRGRTSRVLSSELLRLPAIGPKTARLLWDHFSSSDAMAEASLAEIAAIPGIGPRRAERIHAALAGLRQK